jgi:transposase
MWKARDSARKAEQFFRQGRVEQHVREKQMEAIGILPPTAVLFVDRSGNRRGKRHEQQCHEAVFSARRTAGVSNAHKFHRLKGWRGIATRYAKRASSYRAVVQIRCLFLWAKIS